MNQQSQPVAISAKKTLRPGSLAMQIQLLNSLNNDCRLVAGRYGYQEGSFDLYKYSMAKAYSELMPSRLFYIDQRTQDGEVTDWILRAKLGGSGSVYAEYEIVSLAVDILREAGLANGARVRVNNRMAMGRILRQNLALDTVQLQMIMSLAGKQERLDFNKFINDVSDIFGANSAVFEQFYVVCQAGEVEELPPDMQAIAELRRLDYLIKLAKTTIVNKLEYSFLAMVAAGEYMDFVFEISDDNGEVLCAGGRNKLPALGASEDDCFVELAVRGSALAKFSQTNAGTPPADVGIVVFAESALLVAVSVAKRMRQEGVRVDIDLANFNSQSQKLVYEKKQLPFILFIDSARESSRYRLYDAKLGETRRMSIERAISKILDYRSFASGDDDVLFTLE